MSGFFVLLFFATIILFIIGMVKPSIFSKYYKKPLTRKKIAWVCGLAAFVFFILIGITAPKTPTPEGKSAENQPTAKLYDVVKVVDGDTIDVNIDGKTDRIRLIGVDTPEIIDPNTPVQCYGQESSTEAHKLLDGKKVALEADSTQGERDKYDRLLRYVFIDNNVDFSKVMIENGFGREYTYAAAYNRQAAYKDAQKLAESSKKGLWAADTCAGTTTKVTAPVATTPVTTPTPTPAVVVPVVSAPAQTKTQCLIKGNISSGGKIYHVPGGAYYDKTVIDTSAGERWFCTEAEAVAAGWRASMR